VAERRPVELVEYSPAWAHEARGAAEGIADALGSILIAVHHVGSTSVPGICAKPVIDLLPVVTDLPRLDGASPALRALGYQWRGEFGIPGRRYCTLDDVTSGKRRVQLHCFAAGHPESERMLLFRDYLRSHPDEALAYQAEKERCRAMYPDDTEAYAEAKTVWIRACESRARLVAAPQTLGS
jgi:GrpB-like predicted nucleotidyltransferase (UPF0157 family)